MKVSAAAGFCLLIIIITTGQGYMNTFNPRGPYHPPDCCFTYIPHRIPRPRIVDYYETSSLCSKPGVIFITEKAYSICADPSDDWVQDYIKELKNI